MAFITSGRDKYAENESLIVMQEFSKYHGAGNDFILIDNRKNKVCMDSAQIRSLCNRRIGIGADGLLILHSSHQQGIDFEMQYFNSDGREGTMCGNGGRCMVAFAKRLGMIERTTTFLGMDGIHKAMILQEADNKTEIRLQMNDVEEILPFDDGLYLDTGSPHVVKFTHNLSGVSVLDEGRKIRYDSRFANGTNVNFVEIQGNNTLFVRTFERGVEDETLSCGTGVTASALVFAKQNKPINQVMVETQGGTFIVDFQRTLNGFSDIWLQGETCLVYTGTLV